MLKYNELSKIKIKDNFVVLTETFKIISPFIIEEKQMKFFREIYIKLHSEFKEYFKLYIDIGSVLGVNEIGPGRDVPGRSNINSNDNNKDANVMIRIKIKMLMIGIKSLMIQMIKLIMIFTMNNLIVINF
jgi:hypothetical protein